MVELGETAMAEVSAPAISREPSSGVELNLQLPSLDMPEVIVDKARLKVMFIFAQRPLYKF